MEARGKLQGWSPTKFNSAESAPHFGAFPSSTLSAIQRSVSPNAECFRGEGPREWVVVVQTILCDPRP